MYMVFYSLQTTQNLIPILKLITIIIIPDFLAHSYPRNHLDLRQLIPGILSATTPTTGAPLTTVQPLKPFRDPDPSNLFRANLNFGSRFPRAYA